MRSVKLHPRIVGALILMLAAGCTVVPSRPRVQGKVTYQGLPVGSKTLSLCSAGVPDEFFAQKIPIQADGTFSGEAPMPGIYKVVVEESMAVQEGRGQADPNAPKVPAKYRDAASSDLTWTIIEGNNSKDIELQD